MAKIGTLKVNILHNLTESYIAGDKKNVKDIFSLIRENKGFRELYLFYEEIENMYLEDKDLAKVYVENVETLLKNKVEKVGKYCKELSKKFPEEVINEVEVYSLLDILTENDSLKNIDKKILARKKLVEHLTKKKDITESANEYTGNEHLLHFVLVERFNNDFEKMLNADEKTQLSEMLSMSHDDLSSKFETLKEEIDEKINEMILTEEEADVKDKLDNVLKEARQLPITKYNYYKLQQLRNGL